MEENEVKQIPVLINEEYLKAYSLLPKNYDLTEVMNYVPLAERIHVEPILGEPLYEELLEQVMDNDLTEVNSTLLLEVYRVLGVAVVLESLPFIWSHVSKTGITLGKSDNSDSISNKDLTVISTKLTAQLEYEKKHLKKWLDDRSNSYPLYYPDTVCCKTPTPNNRTLYKVPMIDITIS